jgi:eukaryotic-like serine/threonine-protein kinase
MQPPAQQISSCPTCGGALEETSSGGLGCMICLLRTGIGSEEEVAQDSTREALDGSGHFGVYEVDRREDGSLYELGRGAMGVTYRATDTTLQRKVALKIIKIDLVKRRVETRERFMREARAAAALRHENIATVYQFGIREDTGQYFYAMELIEGETLEERIRRAGPLDTRAAIDIAQQVTAALTAAEKHGLVHRDLKPANLMLVSSDGDTISGTSNNQNFVVKIIDFGLAKALRAPVDPMSLTRGGFVGTPEFASPEQFAPKAFRTALDVRSDIYSLGVTLWFALTGKTPFAGHSVEEIHHAQQSDALPIEQLKAAHVPSSLRLLLESMLALEPASRPGPHDLAVSLQRCSTPTIAARRNRLALAAAVILILGVSAFFLLPSLRMGHRPVVTAEESTLNAVVPAKSIAVLPFENLSEDKANAYFAQGIQEEVLTHLANVADLKVISRASTQRYQSKPGNLSEIAKQLGVANILEGSVQKAADSVRVQVKLIQAADDSHLWADSYDRKLTDIFAIESEIAKTIADTLQAKLTGSEKKQMSKKATENLEAYDLYLRGRFFWNQRTSVDMKTALSHFEEAASLDPNFAVAYAGMADCYLLLPLYGGGVPAEMYPKAIAMAQKAISLDPTLGEPHASLGLVHSLFDFDFAASVREFEEAIRLNPNYAIAHHWFGGSTLPALGQFDRANAEAKRALELDPLSLVMIIDAGTVYWITGRYQEAVAQCRKAIEIDPRNYTAHWQLGQALECIGDLRGAIAEYEKSTQLDDDPLPLGLLAAAKAKAGDRPAALAILNRIQEIAKQRYVPDYSFARIHLALGQKEEALQWLESSYAKQQPDLNWIRVDPDLRPLHGDPRFEALAENIVPAREFNASATAK